MRQNVGTRNPPAVRHSLASDQQRLRRRPPCSLAQILRGEAKELDDTLTRRQARRDLAAAGDDALPIIEQLLTRSSYRLQLGALQALAELPDASKLKISDAIWAKRPELVSYPDATMRQVAQHAFNINFFPRASCYQESDAAKSVDKRYLVLCQWSQADCQTVRGDNPNTVQTACSVTDLRGKGKLQPGGVNGSWYLSAAAEFGDATVPLCLNEWRRGYALASKYHQLDTLFAQSRGKHGSCQRNVKVSAFRFALVCDKHKAGEITVR